MTDFYSIERWQTTETIGEVMARLKKEFEDQWLCNPPENVALDFTVEADETGHFVILKASH